MALQDTYTASQPRFIEGMIPDMRTPGQDVSRNVETIGGIGFGKVAVQGTLDHQIKVSAASAAFIGITVLDTTQLQDSYPRYATARVRTKGPVVVTASVAVQAGQPAFYVPATGVLTNVATSNTQIGKFETSAAAGGLAVLNIT
ncbi:structural cement protein Gp24 [Falsirhodobacter sp. 20TX0035]|uniref:structural cement protein Gp24 n=1 Tax=Falsirhodobacter sp. 20TX0035 TaxID=3022019 RepID=UPI00232DAA8F|nr:hypothetical protein [Falsirhodobacter sp. 20TX0035]MDB6454704.1 hypothetical protein [Falsirhodobacter sp. 20TX0035]